VHEVRLHRSEVEIEVVVFQEAQEGLEVAGVTVLDREEPCEWVARLSLCQPPVMGSELIPCLRNNFHFASRAYSTNNACQAAPPDRHHEG